MTIITDIKDFAQGLARGLGLFVLERNHNLGAAPAGQPRFRR